MKYTVCPRPSGEATIGASRSPPSRSVGTQRTRGSPGSRWRIGGRSRQPASRTTAASGGWSVRTGMGGGPGRRPPWRTLGAGHRRIGQMPGRGVSGDISTRDMCSGRKASLTRPQPGRRSARPHGSTSSSPAVYLKSTDNRPDDYCWRCDTENISGARQTRGHLFNHCYKWKDQQAVMWARVKEATTRGKQKWRVGDLLADERCSPAVLYFLRSTHVGRTAPPVEENWDSEEEQARALLVSWYWVLFCVFSFCLFKMCTFLVRASLVFTRFISLVLSQCAQFVGGGGAGVLSSSPTFRPGRQTGTG